MYNNPFFYGGPGALARRGLFQSLRGINWGNFLSNTQKTLGVINQAIPIVYQVKPIMRNAKTMFKIADTLRRPDNLDTASTAISNKTSENVSRVSESDKPIFFL